MSRSSHKSPSRWYTFSLRTLLILVTISAILFGWIGKKVSTALNQRNAVLRIQELGGQVGYANEASAVFNDPFDGDESWLRRILGDDFFDSVQVVWFYDSVGDADLEVF